MPEPGAAIHEVSASRRWAVRLLAWTVRRWTRTLRLEADAGAWRFFHETREPTVVLFWHNQLFCAHLFRRHLDARRRIHGLVSASRDGAVLAAFFERVGIPVIRGSSSRLGREALLQAIQALRQGRDIAITPDGPRGPVYALEGGAILAARRAGAPLVLLGAEFESAWRLDSWDGFFLPRPGSTVRVRGLHVSPAELRSMEHPTEKIAELLHGLGGAANERRYAPKRRMAARPGPFGPSGTWQRPAAPTV